MKQDTEAPRAGKSQVLVFRMDPDEVEKLDKIAATQCRTRARLIQFAVKAYIASVEA